MLKQRNGKSVGRRKKKSAATLRSKPEIIRQSELERLKHIRKIVAEAVNERNPLIDSIRKRLVQEAEIEPGNLTASLCKSTSTLLNFESLAGLLGRRFVLRIMRWLPTKVTLVVFIKSVED